MTPQARLLPFSADHRDLRPVRAPKKRPRNPYAAEIAAVRRKAGLSRAGLGAAVGVPEATIALWEDESYEGIDLSILERVAHGSGFRLHVGFTSQSAGRTDPDEDALGRTA